MTIEDKRQVVLSNIKGWKDVLSNIELTETEISGVLQCLDFNFMYDLAKELKIVKGYLFSEENKSFFLKGVMDSIGSIAHLETERENLMILKNSSPEQYLEYLLQTVKTKLDAKEKPFTAEDEEKFYKIMNYVSLLNIEAVNKYLTAKEMRNNDFIL